jgi:hypothetical protein
MARAIVMIRLISVLLSDPTSLASYSGLSTREYLSIERRMRGNQKSHLDPVR